MKLNPESRSLRNARFRRSSRPALGLRPGKDPRCPGEGLLLAQRRAVAGPDRESREGEGRDGIWSPRGLPIPHPPGETRNIETLPRRGCFFMFLVSRVGGCRNTRTCFWMFRRVSRPVSAPRQGHPTGRGIRRRRGFECAGRGSTFSISAPGHGGSRVCPRTV